MTEFAMLAETLLFLESDAETIDGESLERLEDEYSVFCDQLPVDFDPETAWRGAGCAYDAFAYDWLMTRAGTGVGFWETSDWEEEAGTMLTELCRKQGSLETYTEDAKAYVY